jgi:hypothetical protein
MINFKITLILCLTLLLVGCEKAADQRKEETSKFKITIMTPAIEEALTQFKKQDRRLEFNGCELRYNDKTFGFDSTIGDLVALFGKYGSYVGDGIYIWHEMGLMVLAMNINHEDPSAGIRTISLPLNSIIPREIGVSNQRSPEPYDYVLLEGFPINVETPFSDLQDLTSLTIEDVGINNGGYYWSYDCGGNQVEYYVSVPGTWMYKGGGHLQYKSHPNPHNENAIYEITIGRKTEEQ